MCGIAGILYHSKQTIATTSELERFIEPIEHRGPDEDGKFLKGPLAIGHKRLSIIDLKSGQQPMSYLDEKLTIVFNGEIYNYLEIRDELIKQGYVFDTDSDTEVILASYAFWGADCVKKFNGMWSFVIYDQRATTTLFCSRDRMGIKPFYFLNDSDRFAFSSEMKSFEQLSGYQYGINKQVIWDHLVFGPKNGGETYLNGIHELAPGHNLTVTKAGVNIEEYYSLYETYENQHSKVDLDEIHSLIRSSIDLRLQADVPLATINSGGLDSSIISAMSKESISDLKTYCIAPENNAPDKITMTNDESSFANLLATHIQSDHKNIRYSNHDFFEHLEPSIRANDGELYHSNSVLMNILFKQIKADGITVVLGGEGADEVFRGYFSNRLLAGSHVAGHLLSSKILLSKYKYLKGLRFISNDIRRLVPFIRSSHLSPAMANKVLGIEGELHSDRQDLIHVMKELSPSNALTFYEQRIYLAGLLRRADRMSMENHIELRVPYLDHRIVEKLNGIDLASKCGISKKSEKKILKKIAKAYVPNKIINRPKFGFGSPLSTYSASLRDRLGNAVITNDSINIRDLWILNAIVSKEKIRDVYSNAFE